MTYLDPDHAAPPRDLRRWIVRGLFAAGLIALGWFAIATGGSDVPRSPAYSAPAAAPT